MIFSSIFEITTSNAPVTLIVPANEIAQTAMRSVFIIDIIPPLWRSRTSSGATSSLVIPIISTLNPFNVTSTILFKSAPWNTAAFISATADATSITGIVGFFVIDPASTITRGTSSKIFQLNI